MSSSPARLLPSVILLLLFSLADIAGRAEAGARVSAARGPDENFNVARERALKKYESDGGEVFRGATPWSTSVPLEKRSGLSALPQWPDLDQANSELAAVRDERFLPSPNDSRFLRRDPWLYPDDGCFARAQSVEEQLATSGLPKPAKLFIFGNLTLATRWSASGSVSWWYHVVPAVRVNGQAMILDPSVDPRHALALQDWIARMTGDPSQVRISVCDPQAYDPYSACQGYPQDTADARASEDLPSFLNLEWDRVSELGYDPYQILGNRPPWRSE